MKKGIITLAFGDDYNKLARYLAWSCMLHCPQLPRAIVTDNPEYVKNFYDVIIPAVFTGGEKDPIQTKLLLHTYTPFYETLYLDVDEVVYTDLAFMWEYLTDRSVVYHGQCRTDGEWRGINMADVIKTYDIPWMGKLNSGIYLFRKDEIGTAALDYAASLYKNHEGLNLPFWREKYYPDEIFFSIAFGKFNLKPVEDDCGRLGRSIVDTTSVKLDVIKGFAKIVKGGKIMFPSIVHFPGWKSKYTRPDYRLERMRLYLYFHRPSYMLPFTLIQLQRLVIFCAGFVRRCFRYAAKRIRR